MSNEQDNNNGVRRQAIRAQIDENLKRVYARTVEEELPDRFKDLLAKLKAREAGNGGDTQ